MVVLTERNVMQRCERCERVQADIQIMLAELEGQRPSASVIAGGYLLKRILAMFDRRPVDTLTDTDDAYYSEKGGDPLADVDLGNLPF